MGERVLELKEGKRDEFCLLWPSSPGQDSRLFKTRGPRQTRLAQTHFKRPRVPRSMHFQNALPNGSNAPVGHLAPFSMPHGALDSLDSHILTPLCSPYCRACYFATFIQKKKFERSSHRMRAFQPYEITLDKQQPGLQQRNWTRW